MKDVDNNKEQLVAVEPKRKEIARFIEGELGRKVILERLLEIDKKQEKHRATVKFGIWTWDVVKDHVIFECRRLRDDGSVESERQFSGIWRGIIDPDDLDRLTKLLQSVLRTPADTNPDDPDPINRYLSSLLRGLRDPIIEIRTVDQRPLIVRCRAVYILDSITTLIGNYVDWSPLLGSLLIKPSESFEMGIARHFAEKFALEARPEVEEIFRAEISKYPSSSMAVIFGGEFLPGSQALKFLERREPAFETILDAVHGRGAVFTQDHGRRYTYVSPAMTSLLGLPDSEILGKTDEELFDGHGQWSLRNIEPESPEKSWHHKVIGRVDGKSELRLSTYWRGPSGGHRIRYWGWVADPSDIEGTIESDGVVTEIGSDGGETGDKPRPMQAALKLARQVANTDSTVLLTGERGVGKDHMARYIHKHSKRAEAPYFLLDCPSVAPSVAESEFFGYEKGAHNVAEDRKLGLLEQAEGGTLLISEIGDLPLPLQAKLLRFIETKTFIRVGGTRKSEVTIKARIIAATNKDLEQEMKSGGFREDLFDRLNVVRIHIPPLRERKEEIRALAAELWGNLRIGMGQPDLPDLHSTVLKRLMDYDWPGNVRELRNVLERAIVLGCYTILDFPFPQSRSDSHSSDVEKGLDADTNPDQSELPPGSLARIVRPHGNMRRKPIKPERKVLADLKKKWIDELKFPIEQLADALRVDRSTLGKWFKQEGL